VEKRQTGLLYSACYRRSVRQLPLVDMLVVVSIVIVQALVAVTARKAVELLENLQSLVGLLAPDW